ncbi:MAG: tetratricopeptide repeat protein [Pseudohongiellaceae bacterium]
MKPVFTVCLVLVCLCPLSTEAQQNFAAEVVSREGEGEWRTDIQAEWAEAGVTQQLSEGNFIRTGSRSKLGLLFRDQSQMRLNQNSLLIVRDVLDEQGSSTRFELNQGRAWVKSKQIPDSLIMETPSAVAAIRGTDWDIEVGADGSTILTVLHGSVELSNAFGTVTVNRNEQGIAAVNTAPFILQIRNPESRIQWVAQYQLRPLSYLLTSVETLSAQNQQVFNLLAAGALSAAQQIVAAIDTGNTEGQLLQAMTAIYAGNLASAETILEALDDPSAVALLADIYLYAGEAERVIELLAESPQLNTYPQLASLLAQAYFMQDETEQATALLDEYLLRFPESVHLLLSKGEIAIFSGDAELAIQSYEQVLANDPENAEAYYGIGRVYGEREFVSEALASLNLAIQINASDASYTAEKATVETFASMFNAAEVSLEQSLDLQPANAVALTGKGVLLLKQGNTVAAIQEFLKASLIEPRYARVLVYLAIAYYQQGNAALALDTLDLAKEIDDKDPLPYFLESTIRKEQFLPSESILASRNAMNRLPNLKSLNQVIIDQKGNTNLGAALSNYGLIDWALKIAVDSYNPFWAGSALFLSNQVASSDYVSLSEKFKGLMTNPLAFGAPNRFSSLITKPGNYAALGGVYSTLEGENFESKLTMPTVTLNGLNIDAFPVAYFYSDNSYKLNTETRDKASGISFDTALEPDIRTYGVGATPTNKLKLFYFVDEQSWGAGQHTVPGNGSNVDFSILTNNDQQQQAVGAQYAFSPEQKLDFSYTRFEMGIDQTTNFSNSIDSVFPPARFTSESNTITISLVDNFLETIQLRYERKIGNHFLSLGFANIVTENHLDIDNKSVVSSEFYSDGELLSSSNTLNVTETFSDSQLDENRYYLHYLYQAFQNLQIELDLTRSSFDVSGTSVITDISNDVSYNTPQQPFSFSDNYLSAGINYELNDKNNIRLAYQDYLHFNLANTLNYTTTAGIPYQTEYLLTGSMQQRTRLQWESTYFKDTYFNLYFDYIKTENDFFTARDVILPTVTSGLDRISQLSDRTEILFTDDYKSNSFSADSVDRGELNIMGFDINRVLTDRMGMYFKFSHVDSTVFKGANEGEDFLNIPLQKTRLGLTYSSSFRLKVGLQVDYLTFAEGRPDEYLTFARDGVYARLSFVQDFMNRRLLAYGQLIMDQTTGNPTRNFSIGLELRL